MNNVVTSMRNVTARLRGYRAGITLLRDPTKLDMVFELNDAFPDQERLLAEIARSMRVHPHVAAALAEQPRLSIDLAELRVLPDGTFGREAARFMDVNGLDPRAIPKLEGEGELAWTKAHLYETHDIWHVATGFATDIAGELALQAFYAAQLPGRLPQMLVTGGLLQAAFWYPEDFRSRLAAIARGWDAGVRAKPLFGVRWDLLWREPIERVRADLALG
jgi:ubiquinone biosynthesis protein Coq4